MKITSEITIDFFEYRDIDTLDGFTSREIEYFRKYPLGCFFIFDSEIIFKIENEDLLHFYNNLLVKNIPKIVKGERVKVNLWTNEMHGLVIESSDGEELRIYEYVFDSDPNSEDRVRQEVTLKKSAFLGSIFDAAIRYNNFHSNAIIDNPEISIQDFERAYQALQEFGTSTSLTIADIKR